MSKVLKHITMLQWSYKYVQNLLDSHLLRQMITTATIAATQTTTTDELTPTTSANGDSFSVK